MIKKILSGYSKLFVSLVKILCIVAFCAFCACVVVFPLWKFATALPAVYTVFVFAVLFTAVVISFFFRLKKSPKTKETISETNNQPVILFFQTVVKIAIIVVGLFVSGFFLLQGMAIGAIAAVVITIIMYGILAFGLKTEKTALSSAQKSKHYTE